MLLICRRQSEGNARGVSCAHARRPVRGVGCDHARGGPRGNQAEHGAGVGCIAGALEEREFARLLAAAGFEAISFEPTRVYEADDAREFLIGAVLDPDAIASDVDGRFLSAFVRARKPTP